MQGPYIIAGYAVWWYRYVNAFDDEIYVKSAWYDIKSNVTKISVEGQPHTNLINSGFFMALINRTNAVGEWTRKIGLLVKA